MTSERGRDTQLVVRCNKPCAAVVSLILSRELVALSPIQLAPNSCRAMRKQLRRRLNLKRDRGKSENRKSRFAMMASRTQEVRAV